MRNRALIVALGLFATTSASAYVLEGFDWMWQPNPVSDPWELNSTSFPVAAGSLIEIEDGFVGGLDAWNNAGNAYFAWTYGGITTDLSYTYDTRMISQWHVSTGAAGTLAETRITYYGDDAVECDMRFYGSNAQGSIAWSADPLGAPPGEFDFQKVATHEIGHCVGLDHSGNSDAIMYWATNDGTGPSDRALHQDDIDGLNAIYTEYVPEPDLDLVSASTEDLGDGDGYFEAGEIIGVTFRVDNEADAEAINAIATLNSDDSRVRVNTAIGAPTEIDHPGLTTLSYYGAELRVSDDCTELEVEAEYEVAFSADNYSTGLYWIIDIDLDCLGPDLDGDGVPEALDLCEGFNDNADKDDDGVPNRCDPCPDDNPDDSDGDGVCEEDDVCPGFDDTLDADDDGTPDDCEEVVTDPDQIVSESPAGCACSSQGGPSPWIAFFALFLVRRRV